MDDEQTKEKTLNDFELGNELYTLVESNVIPAFIADKIKEKLKDAGIKLSNSQLYELVEIIKKEIQTRKYSYTDHHPQEKKEVTPHMESIDNTKDEDVEKVFKTIENLGNRIKRIEDTKVEYPRDSVGKIVTPEDIHIPEKISVPQYGAKAPALQEIPNDPERVVVLMKWLQFLVDKVGKDNLSNVLDYYVDIGWISDKIVTNLIEYSEGVTEEKKHKETAEKKELQANDHIQSLLFIQRLKGGQPDNYFLHRIERKINKMTKNLSATE
ncbi:MAG: hypothetical protein JSW60_05895 [Thermoplasmatales archaeon]|nr:MAG: hypothetical protein JSW60_05895 [Thermoplasmatales archaeon]